MRPAILITKLSAVHAGGEQGWNRAVGLMEPVACSIRSGAAHRNAVWEIGPRPDPTRSARNDEPGGTAIQPGDRSQGLTTALLRRTSRDGSGEKNGGLTAPTLGSRLSLEKVFNKGRHLLIIFISKCCYSIKVAYNLKD